MFFENVIVKVDKATHLKKELKKYSVLPQHMKRVQINETSEYYQPLVLNDLAKNEQPDIMLQILNAFQSEWQKGNRWMLHILTKSPKILMHIDKLKEMREMVQIEVSFATNDDDIKKELEFYSPSIAKRFELVETLAKENIFVRIMAMPFFGERRNLEILKQETFNRGAQAFKNKGLNYYKDWEDLRKVKNFEQFLSEPIPTGKGRVDQKDESLIIKSGELILPHAPKRLLMPRMDNNFVVQHDWSAISLMDSRFANRDMEIIDCGYSKCNNFGWGYIN